MNSTLCQGWVSHRRYAPRAHAFVYRIGMLYLDLDEQAQVSALSGLLQPWRLAPLCWRERDYLPAWTTRGIPLAEAVRERVREALGIHLDGAIHLLTQPRSWGLSFNPLSLFFCHDAAGQLRAVLCEVRNTPWRERFHYVMPVSDSEPEVEVAKAFHVSPFLPLDMHYRMRFRRGPQRLHVHMENWRDGHKLFEADLALRRQPLDAPALRRHVLAFPWMSLRTVTAIYWQALRLLLKRTPLYDHASSQRHTAAGHLAAEESAHVRTQPERQQAR